MKYFRTHRRGLKRVIPGEWYKIITYSCTGPFTIEKATKIKTESIKAEWAKPDIDRYKVYKEGVF